MAEINCDKKVMEFFPATQSREQTKRLIQRMQKEFLEQGFCYFAVEKTEDDTFIGFIGLSQQVYIAPFTPCVETKMEQAVCH